MADVLNETDYQLNDTVQNATTKTPATPEGMALAYGSLLFMALVPIVVGSFRSVRLHREQKVLTGSCVANVWALEMIVVSYLVVYYLQMVIFGIFLYEFVLSDNMFIT